MRNKVELWSTEPSAVEATRATVAMLGGTLYQDESGAFWIESASGYAALACKRQGYVKAVHPLAPTQEGEGRHG